MVTHLVVEPEGRSGLARLVPLSLAEAEADTDDYDVRAAPGKLRLRCTEAEFMNLDGAEETLAEFAVGQTVPVQLLPPGWRGTGEPVAEGGDIPRIPERETVDVVPPGQVEEHGGDHVHATDGDIGRLHGFRIDRQRAGDPRAARRGARVGSQGRRHPVRQDHRVRWVASPSVSPNGR